MDQYKTGKFIAECRKKQNLTQMQLAEKLNITDRAVSKWETGKAMPDSSLMLELCGILEITVNDLLHGEVISPEEQTKKLEEQLVDIIDGKELSDKWLARVLYWLAFVAVFASVAIFLIIMFPEAYLLTKLLTVGVSLNVTISSILSIKILRFTGYYECETCSNVCIPSKKEWFFALGFTENRMKFRCSCCDKKTWHRKIFRKK